MRLRRPCEHDRYEPHWKTHTRPWPEDDICPGGEFLPEDALVVVWWCEKHKSQQFDEESCWLRRAVGENLEPPCVIVEKQLVPAAVQVGEPG